MITLRDLPEHQQEALRLMDEAEKHGHGSVVMEYRNGEWDLMRERIYKKFKR